MSRGKFITFEGLDGSGKSTHLQKLAAVLRAQGIDVVTTREPGGTAIGDKIRALLLDSRTRGLDPLAELALMFASRAQLVRELILPALQQGQYVLSDRFTDSSEAYQGGGRRLGAKPVLDLHRTLCGNLKPDLTLLMMNDPRTTVSRARRRNAAATARRDENRFEREDRDFFQRTLDAYLEIARREPERVVLINARRSITAVHRDIVAAVRERLGP